MTMNEDNGCMWLGGRDPEIDGMGTQWVEDCYINALRRVHFRFNSNFWDPKSKGQQIVQNFYTTLNEGIEVVQATRSSTGKATRTSW